MMDTFDSRYFKFNKLLLTLSGVWPFQSPRYKSIFLYNMILGILIIFLPQVAYICKHARRLEDLYEVLPSLIGSCICLTKVAGLHFKSKKLGLLVKHVHKDWRRLEDHEDIRVLLEYIEIGRLFTLVYTTFLSVAVACYFTAPITTVPLMDMIMATNVTRPKRLPHPSEFFIDQEKYFYVLLIITYVGYACCLLIGIAGDTIFFVLLQHTCGMITILSNRLDNLIACDKLSCIDDRNSVSTSKKDVEYMIQCIQLQVRIERLIQLVESAFSICLCGEIGFGVLFQCSTCVMIVTHTDIMEIMRNGPLLLVQCLRGFCSFWMGQRLIDHSSRISEAAYNGIWYQSSIEVRKMLVLLLLKCQKPYRITTAKLYVISLEGYSMIMRASLSYVTLMVSLHSDDA